MIRATFARMWAGVAAIILCCSPVRLCFAEKGFVLVQVQDSHHRPVAGLEVGIDGVGGSQLTGSDGKARLALGSAVQPSDLLTLSVLHSPKGRDLVMVSPWDSRAQVPSFEDKPENFVRIVVVERKDRAALEDGSVVAALAEKINNANAGKRAEEKAGADPRAALLAIAKQYGLTPDDVDHAVRDLGARTSDPYQAGLAALYERNYPKASADLETSLKQREASLAAEEARMTEDRKQVADAAFFLGASLYQQGRYRESVVAYQRCLQLRDDDPTVMNNLALSMKDAGDYAGAEPLYRRALAIDEKALGPEHTDVATVLNNLAGLLEAEGEYASAEPLYHRALTIDEKALGPEQPGVATDLNNLAGLLRAKGDYAGAEPLYRRALAIDERALGPEHPDVAGDLNNLGGLLYAKGDYADAEPLYRRALAMDEKALGPEHPDLAVALNNLALLLRAKGDYADAEPLYLRALAIDEKALGPEHPDGATGLNNLALLLYAEGNYGGAEPLYRRALAIDEKALGLEHPHVARDLNNLAHLLEEKGDYAGADLLYRRALAIDEKALGPEHPTTKTVAANLDKLQAQKSKQQ